LKEKMVLDRSRRHDSDLLAGANYNVGDQSRFCRPRDFVLDEALPLEEPVRCNDVPSLLLVDAFALFFVTVFSCFVLEV
jgi:hypothetical protein